MMVRGIRTQRGHQKCAQCLAATVVSLLLVSGCGRPVNLHSGGLALQSIRISWQRGNIPTAIAEQYAQTDWHALPVASRDGNLLYGCAIGSDRQDTSGNISQEVHRSEIWVTHDRALH